MNVVKVRGEIPVASDQVFPVAALRPDSLLTSRTSAVTSFTFSSSGYVAPRKSFLDETPARWVVAVSVWKRPERMQVVGQYDLCLQNEGTRGSDFLHGILEHRNGKRVRE